MKNTGIITLNGESNYGNRLQNYALQQALSKLGYKSETVVFASSKAKAVAAIKNVAIRVLPFSHTRLDYWRMLHKKQGVFRPFSRKRIQANAVNPSSKDNVASDYDFFITGSDQVWNPNYIKGRGANFLSFAPKAKRISYAASFGVSEIPVDQRDFYRQHLSDMRTISVREEAGVDIVKQITNRDATLVPDPTILLSRPDWDSLTVDYSHLADEKYLIIYSLHDLNPDAHDYIRQFAKANDLEIYQAMGDFYNPDHKIPDPAEFVARIKYAQAVFTDSFHACVFSIIMNTPFKVYERTDMKMSSRIDTLLKTYGLEVASKNGELVPEEYNFNYADETLGTERQKGFDFLREALEQRQ